jgi:deoxyribodipyrimidine photo-lyase
MTSLYWVRTDLRVLDNETLTECLKKNQETIFVFAQTKSLKRADDHRRKFFYQCADEFQMILEKQGFTVLKTELFFADFLPSLLKTHPVHQLYFTKEYAWEERSEERLVEEFCLKNEIQVHSFDQGTLIRQNDLPFRLEEMPFVFTNFRTKIEQSLTIKPLVSQPFSSPDNPGLERLKHYLWKTHAIQKYKETRNGLIDFDDSSKLSPWLNVGSISARTVYYELKSYEAQICKNESTYWLLFELLWRDYFKFFSLKYSQKIFLKSGINPGTSLNQNDLSIFQSWCDGLTPDPFINANMNELNLTGWMSNRGRQNVASYLIHDLGLNWTWGASYFEKKLIDYDPDVNWGNWLYLSGRGSDPRARKFNTQKQAMTYDPNGEYQKRWGKNHL